MSFCEFLPLKIQKNLDNILRDKLPKKKKRKPNVAKNYKLVKTLFLSDFFLVFYILGFYSSVKNVRIVFIT